jgi:hypothetical protein
MSAPRTTKDDPSTVGGQAPGTARDREMGREAEPLGDLGHRGKTWTPPEGEQGISNRPGDEAVEDAPDDDDDDAPDEQ